jgi:serine/threonine protein kinase
VKQRLKLINFGIAKRLVTSVTVPGLFRAAFTTWSNEELDYVFFTMLKSKAIAGRGSREVLKVSVTLRHISYNFESSPSGSWFLRCRIASNTTNISRESSVGTISYMAPEAVKQGAVKIGRPSDVWSLGIILRDTQSGDVWGFGGFKGVWPVWIT